MVERTSLCPIIILLSVLLIADIGLISGIAHAISRTPKDDRSSHENGLRLYVIVSLPFLGFAMIIAIVMLTVSLISKTQHTLSRQPSCPNVAVNVPEGPIFAMESKVMSTYML